MSDFASESLHQTNNNDLMLLGRQQFHSNIGQPHIRHLDDLDDRHNTDKYGHDVKNPPPPTRSPTRPPTRSPTRSPTRPPTPGNGGPITTPIPTPAPSPPQPTQSCDDFFEALRSDPNVAGFQLEFSFDLETRANFPITSENNEEILSALEAEFIKKQMQNLGILGCVDESSSRYLDFHDNTWLSGDPPDEILAGTSCLSPGSSTNCQVSLSKQSFYFLKSGDDSEDLEKKNKLILSTYGYLEPSINRGNFISAHNAIVKMTYRSEKNVVRPLSPTTSKKWEIYHSVIVGIGLYLIFAITFIMLRRNKVFDSYFQTKDEDEHSVVSRDLSKTQSEEFSFDNTLPSGFSSLEKEYAKCSTTLEGIEDENDQTPLMKEVKYPDSAAHYEENMRNERRRKMLLEASGQLPSPEEKNSSKKPPTTQGSLRWLVQSKTALVSNGSALAHGTIEKFSESSRNLLSGTTGSQRRLMKKTKDRDDHELAILESKQSDTEATWKPRSTFNFDYNSDSDTKEPHQNEHDNSENDANYDANEYRNLNVGSRSSSSTFEIYEEEYEDRPKVEKFPETYSQSSNNREFDKKLFIQSINSVTGKGQRDYDDIDF